MLTSIWSAGKMRKILSKRPEIKHLLFVLVWCFGFRLRLCSIYFTFFSVMSKTLEKQFYRLLTGSFIIPVLAFFFFILIVYFSGILLKTTKVGGILSKIPVLGLFFGQGEIITISRLMNMQPCLFSALANLYFLRLDTFRGKGPIR